MNKKMITTLFLILFPLLSFAADPHSYAQPEKFQTKHIDLDFNIDAEKQSFSGSVILSMERKDESAPLILDSQGLKIDSVQLIESKNKFTNLTFSQAATDPILGEKLEILLPKTQQTFRIKITYTPGKNAKGLQWNKAEQTSSKRPFLSTNNEPIGARSWIPCQDTPVMRATYTAKIHIVQTDLMAVMSANNNPSKVNPKGEYSFAMDIPVPSYLIALGVGKLGFKSTGTRTGVYAEPEILNQAADEFSETENMLAAAEKLYGKYVWGRYDLLVLPASFPWGGMENPKLTFVTPTLITGKKDLVDVIAHEIAHSWSGNLVTNAEWNDIWINEGFTTYVQYRIIEQLHGTPVRMRDMALDKLELENYLKESDTVKADTRLKTDFKGRDPDDIFTDVPYTKGALMLYTIEQNVGKEKFDSFLKNYFSNHMFKSITTAEVVDEFSKITDRSFLEEWIQKPGLPKSVAPIQSTIVEHINSLVKSFKFMGSIPSQKDLNEMTSKDTCYFLQSLSKNMNKYKLDVLDKAFGFSTVTNPEIKTLWYKISLKKNYETSMQSVPYFLSSVGRGKYVTPVYEALLETKKGRKLAMETFEKNKLFYSPMIQARIEKKIQGK